MRPVDLPLARWAQTLLDDTGVPLRAAALMRERTGGGDSHVFGPASAKGGTRLYAARDGWIALNLAREDDSALLPALFGETAFGTIAAACRARSEAQLVAQGRQLGMAIAGLHETPLSPAVSCTAKAPATASRRSGRVLDLSALWAGPLAARLLMAQGFSVTRVRSVGREDPTRTSDPAHYAALNDGKAEVSLDLRRADGRDALLGLVRESDIVIEAARPRALRQLGIDADALVRAQAGLTWITITGHGTQGDCGEWVAFGDDAAVAAGLSHELFAATGLIGFVGDAIADPLTGIAAAHAASAQHRQGIGARLILSMAGVVRAGIAASKTSDPAAWEADLHAAADASPHTRAAVMP